MSENSASSQSSSPRKLFIISDLHLGGTPDQVDANGALERVGSRICRSARHIRDFVDWVRVTATESTELIINGDVVDFLAVDLPKDGREWIDDEDEVIRRFDLTVARSREGEERGPFDAMRSLLAAGHHVTILLGNHDVELALPRVCRHLEESIEASPGRFRFIRDGQAYVRGRMLIEHGNRYDRWNIIDFTRLRQECAHRSRGLPIDASLRSEAFFAPPAGTLLVVHAMNHFLPDYPFLNLLKPETATLVPLLLALRPNLWPLLERCFNLGKIPELLHRGRLRSAAVPAEPGKIATPTVSPGGAFGTVQTLAQELGLTIGKDAARLFTAPEPPGPVPANIGVQSSGQIAVGWLYEKARALAEAAQQIPSSLAVWREHRDHRAREKLLVALRTLATDTSFVLDKEKANYLDAAAELARSGGFTHIVFGHTHLPKEIAFDVREQGAEVRRAIYLNTGTWADVIRVPPEIFSEDEASVEKAFDGFFGAMKSGHLSGHLRRYLCYVEARIAADGTVEAHLRGYGGRGQESIAPLEEPRA